MHLFELGKKIGEWKTPILHEIKIEDHILLLEAIHRQTGLAMMLGGNGKLAQAMGPDEEMTTKLPDPVNFILCHECFMSRFGELIEMINSNKKEK